MNNPKIQYRPDAAENQEQLTLDDDTNVVQLRDDDTKSDLMVLLEYVARNSKDKPDEDSAIRKVLDMPADWRARLVRDIRLQSAAEAQARQEEHNEQTDRRAAAIERWRTGYTKLPNEVLMMAGVAGAAKLIYIGLLAHQERRGYTVVEHETLGAYVDLGPKQVSRYLHELQDAGWVEIQRRGTRKANGYRLNHLAPVFKKPKRR
jgi:hypothetical protein